MQKYNQESSSTQSQTEQNALFQKKVSEQAINIMGDTVEDVDIDIEQKDNKK